MENQNTPGNFNRRDVLKGAGLAAGVSFMVLPRGHAAEPLKNVRVGIVGTGGRGTYLLSNLVRLEGVKVPALCDVNEAHLSHAQEVVTKAGQPKPEGYSRG